MRRKARQASRPDNRPLFWGRHAVAAALANPERRVRRLLALSDTSSWLDEALAAARARLPQNGRTIVDRETLDETLPPGAVHQGVAILADPLPEPAVEDIIEAAAGRTPQIFVLLDRVSDPHNVGAVLRSAAVFGALAVIVPEHGTPEVTGALAKSASGALETVPLLRVVNLVRLMDRLKELGFWCVGLDETAEESLSSIEAGRRVALVLGAEGEGLRRLTRERCDFLARLPAKGPMLSLNVSNAAAVALYELVRETA